MPRKKRAATTDLRDWRTITDEREKYAAYLCSREWSELKQAVHKRAGDRCERCQVLPISAVHHLSYSRKYAEELEDLQAICQPCHDFTHGKSDFDPRSSRRILHYLNWCRAHHRIPCPIGCLNQMGAIALLRSEFTIPCIAIQHLYRLGEVLEMCNAGGASGGSSYYMLGDIIADKINELLPFEFANAVRSGILSASATEYNKALDCLGLPSDGDYYRERDEE